MARLGPAGKVRRVIEFMLGLRDDRVLEAMAAHGFGEADRAKGWELLRALGMTQAVPVPTSEISGTLALLDAWRHEWIRIVHVSLAHSFPDVDARLFRGIGKTRQESILFVPAFLDRFEKLERVNDASSRAAFAKLRSRGFTAERRQEARRMLQELLHVKRPTVPDPEIRRAAIHQAEAALWEYFVEWSQIARAVLKDARLLKLLGYRGGQAPDEEHTELRAAEKPVRTRVSRTKKPKRKVRAQPRSIS